MYEITIENPDGTRHFLHANTPDSTQRILSGKLNEEAGSTPKLACTLSPQNLCYGIIADRRTLVFLHNTATDENEFEGYVLNTQEQFTAAGKRTKKLTCEGFQGYLCDTVQMYHTYEDTPTAQFLAALLECHNAQAEPCKQIYLGMVNVTGTRSKTTAYRSTWGEIKENLLDRLGGEIRVRRGNDGKLYLDYLVTLTHPQEHAPVIMLANNLRALSVETDTGNIVTRLIPLGAKTDDETAERLTIVGAEIEGQTIEVPYIDDSAAIAKYGIIAGTAEFDDITVKENLYARGAAYLAENNRLRKHYAAGVLDVSGGALHVGNTYRFYNPLMQFDEYLRLLRKTTDILKPFTPTVEIGDKTVKLSGITAQNRNLINYEIPRQISDTVQTAKDIATNLINAATTGYVVVRPNEILIMDTDDIATAASVWRMNSGGIGYSSTGYAGPYGLAITMNGQIVADFIAAGYMYADRIRGGTLRMGGLDNVNGVIEVADENDNVVCRFDRNGAYILGTVYTRNQSGYWLELSDGNLSGGQGANTYTVLDATTEVTDIIGGVPHTYRGLRVWAEAVSFENCAHIGANGYMGMTGTLQVQPIYSDLENVAVLNPDGQTHSYVTLHYVSGVQFSTGGGVHIEKGLVTA